MQIFVILTPGDEKRKENILQQFASQSTRYKYDILPARMNPAQPAVGIMQSFKKCVEYAKDLDLEQVCIFEDDFRCLNKRSVEWFFYLYNNSILIDHPGSIFLAGLYEGEIDEMFALTKACSPVRGKLAGLHAIIIPKELYDTVLSAEEPYNLDHWLSQIAKVPIFTAYPLLIVQNDGYSYNAGKKTHYTEELHLKYRFIK